MSYIGKLSEPMSGAALLLALSLQGSEPRLPVTVRCDLDTEIPLSEISVTVEEKRETRATPELQAHGGGRVTLTDLPEGDLHLLFYRDTELLGRVKVASAKKGELIRLRVRLVEGNAIALDEFRVRGVSEPEGSEAGGAKAEPVPGLPADRASPESVPAAERRKIEPAPNCPPPGEPLTLTGRLVRIIDNDSFELESGPWSYTVYIGSATRILRSGRSAAIRDLAEGLSLTVKGTVAAGPQGECSVGAKEIRLRP